MNIEIANRLVTLRKEKGLSQEQLAEALGISRQAVSKWERAESSPDTDNLICLAKLYNVSLDELLNTEDDIKTIKDEQICNNVKDDCEDDEDKKENTTVPISTPLKIMNSSFPIICVIIFFIIGSCFHIWHPTWTVFLLIPCYYSLVDAIRHKKASDFAYPVFITFIYLLVCSIWHVWHPFWIIYITVPIYYTICDQLKKSK